CLAACFLSLPVENRTYHFHGIRLSPCARSPWEPHEASLPIAPVPPATTRGQLARALGTFVSLFSQARGLRHGEHSPCGRRSRPPTTMPHPTLRAGLGVSLGAPLPPSHSP